MSAAVERISRISCLSIVALLLSCVLTVTLTSTVDASTSGDYDYVLIDDDRGVMITGYHGTGGYVTIPSTIDGKPVMSIGYLAFAHTSMTSVTVPDSVTAIENYGLAYCSMTFVTIPDSVTRMGNWAFYDCPSLISVTVPGSVKSIGDGAFERCHSLTSVTIESNVTSIGAYAFADCPSLTSVLFHGNAPTVSETWTNWDPTVTAYYYKNAIGFTTPTWEGVRAIPILATDFDYILIDNDADVMITGYHGTDDSVIVPSTIDGKPVIIIGSYTFYNCPLTSVIIPDSVVGIREGAFDRCSSLTEINVSVNNAVYTSIDGILFNKATTKLILFPSAKSNLTIPDSVTRIGNSEFAGCPITSVTMPDSVTSIGDMAFANCHSLASVNIPDSVTYIGGYAFVQCYSLTSVIIPDSVTIIGNGAFSYCPLTSVIVPDSVTYLGNGAFDHCALYSVTISDSVTCIGGYLFANCGSLTSVTIPSSVVCIYPSAFANCGSLTSIIFKGNVAPAFVYTDWIDGTPAEIRGYAPSTSNFPATGESFYGLIMASSASTTTVPSQPIELQTDVDNGSIVLHWSAPSTDGGNNITSYRIYRGTDQSSMGLVGEVNATSYRDANVTEGVSYCYYVVAVNDLGESPASSTVSDEIVASSTTTDLGPGDSSPTLLIAIIVGLIVVSVICGVIYMKRKKG